jgi:hypothetical protein
MTISSQHGQSPEVQGIQGVSEEEASRLLAVFRLLLHAGANPDAFRIKGAQPGGRSSLGGGLELYSTGEPGEIVPSTEGGLSALEFVEQNNLSEFRDALLEHGKKR